MTTAELQSIRALESALRVVESHGLRVVVMVGGKMVEVTKDNAEVVERKPE